MHELSITPETAPDLIKQIEDAFYDIPFENSDFQNEAFVVAAQITPERAYRAIGLRIHSKLRALQEAHFNEELSAIQEEELRYKMSDHTLSVFDRRRAEVELKKILSGKNWTNKLMNDAIHEISVLYKHLKALPEYSREQFEAGERRHFEQKLTRQVAGISGAGESLVNMSEDLAALQNFEAAVSALPNKSPDEIERVTVQSLVNMIELPKGF